ncbi:MAG TPA: hypothetical protein VFQ85_01065 [Mycobacteriales bacterium]|nr:hypothetical protein [Mycobacteriales bacterium]
MSDPLAPPPSPFARAGCVVALVALFVVGFAGVGAVLLLRAPDSAAPAESPLVARIARPDGYVLLDDTESGGGRLPESRAATLLGVPAIEGYRDGVLRAFGRPPGEPPRAVVVLVLDVGTPEAATALASRYRDAAVRAGATTVTAPAPYLALAEPPDAAGRYAQRVVVARDRRLWVVSVVTPDRAAPPAEPLALAATAS